MEIPIWCDSSYRVKIIIKFLAKLSIQSIKYFGGNFKISLSFLFINTDYWICNNDNSNIKFTL